MKFGACKCEKCQGACQRVAGWFVPGQAERTAAEIGLTLQQFFDEHLAVDFWGHADWREDQGDIFVLRPKRKSDQGGGIMPYRPFGTCTFFENGLCGIHAFGKPQECVFYIHEMTNDEVHKNHKDCARAWDNPAAQKQIVDLLGFEPMASEPESLLEAFLMEDLI